MGLQEAASGLALQGGKKEALAAIPPKEELYAAVAEIAYSVEEHNGMGVAGAGRWEDPG